MGWVVGVHGKSCKQPKHVKVKLKFNFFLCNGRLRSCRQIYECRFGLTIYKEKMKKFHFCLIKFTSKDIHCKQSCICQPFIDIVEIFIENDS
jgi:hypothetical protein